MYEGTVAPGRLRSLLQRRPVDGAIVFGVALFIVLLLLNIASNPQTFGLEQLPVTIGFAAPIVLVAFATTPSLLMGSGGIDLSVGPVMGLVNVVIIYQLVERFDVKSPFILIPAALGIGVAAGLINGIIVAFIRIQPIVATLGTYLVYVGLTVLIAPTPGGQAPEWLATLAGTFSFVPIVVALLIWWGFRHLPFYEHLMAYGGDERAVYTSGINVKSIRIGAFAFGGLFAGLGGLSLSAVLGSADPTVGANYTLLGIAAAALGGISLAGGRGGMLRALLGALAIFLLQNLLTFWNVSSFVLQVAYGTILVVAVTANGQFSELVKRVSSR